MSSRSRKTTILVTASTFPRWTDDLVPRFVEEQPRFIQAQHPEIDIHVLVPHHAGASKQERASGLNIYRFSYFWPLRWQKLVYPAILPNIKQKKWLILQIPFLLLFEFLATWRLVRILKPDFLYAHWFVPQGITAGLVSMLTGIPCAFTSHSSDVQIMNKIPWIGTHLSRFFIRRMYAITVVSRRSLEKLKAFFNKVEWSIIEQKTAVIPMGVDIDQIRKRNQDSNVLKTQFGLSNHMVIFFIGRLAEKKGVTYLLRSFAQLKSDHPTITLIIAGDGPLKVELEQEAVLLGIGDRTQFIGYTSGKTKLDYLNLCDIMVVPSIITESGDAEGLPVALLEGLAAGKICIATDVSGADDIIRDGENGYLIPQKDIQALNTAIKIVLALSEPQRNNMLAKARTTAESFNWRPIANMHYTHLFSDRNVRNSL